LQKERKRSGGCALEIGLYLKEHPFPLLLHPPPARSATGIRGWKTGIRGWITGIRATGKRNKGIDNACWGTNGSYGALCRSQRTSRTVPMQMSLFPFRRAQSP
jgi:hypothetical protein